MLQCQKNCDILSKVYRRVRMLKSLDLFSGIGGITLALKGLCKPVAYCEIDPHAQCVLNARMDDGMLPRAPVHDDVRTLTRKQLAPGTRVDIIVGGWPCQDLSVIGLHRGMGHGTRSGLIAEVYRLVDELHPKALFLENVPEAVNHGLRGMVTEFVAKRGYEMRWAVIPASSVGAPHLRKRFFCLLMRPGWSHVFSGAGYQGRSWRREPARMFLKQGGKPKDHRHRMEMMGNAVVPDCVRAAFITLATGFHTLPSLQSCEARTFRTRGIDPDMLMDASASDSPKWGAAIRRKYHGAQLYGLRETPSLPGPTRDILLDRSVFKRRRSRVVNTRGYKSPLLARPKRLAGWATPRRISQASNILTRQLAAAEERGVLQGARV
jgi:hypothetical protein